MRTEIVIPFAFDTEPIEKRLSEHGEEEVYKILHEMVKKDVIAQVPKKEDYYGRSNGEPDWRRLMRECFVEWLDAHSEEIVDEASLLLAQRGSSRKKWRDVLREMKGGDDD